MTKSQERDLIYQMIDALQKKIIENPLGKIFMEEELEELQRDLKGLVKRTITKTKTKKGETRNGL